VIGTTYCLLRCTSQLLARLGPAEMSALQSLSGGEQTFNNPRGICASASRRLAKVTRKTHSWQRFSHGLRMRFAQVLVCSAVTIPTRYLPVSSRPSITATRHAAASISWLINNHHR
jgi:hypothetical protein